MLVYITDKEFNVKYIIDYYKSVIWNTKLSELSDFEIYLPVLDDTILNNIKPNFFVWIDKYPTDVRVIEKIDISYNISDGFMLTISGYDSRCLLKRRVFKNMVYGTYNVSDVIWIALYYNVVNPTDDVRKINCIELNTFGSTNKSITVKYFGENIFDTIKELTSDLGYGFCFQFDTETKKFNFYYIEGLDRSSTQNTNDIVTFSMKLGNLLEYSMQQDNSDFKNVAYIYGEDFDTSRTRVQSGDNNASDLDRFETSINASEVSKSVDSNIVLTQTEYEKILTNNGNDYLTNFIKKYEFDCKVYADVYKFRTDYNVGDTIDVTINYEINGSNSIKGRVKEVTESWSDTGYECLPIIDFS